LWCAQDIEANEFWDACGFEAIAARHGSRSRGRVHIFWVGRTAKGKNEPMRFPRATRGGLMRERRQVYEVTPGNGQSYREIVLPEHVEPPKSNNAPKHQGTSGTQPRKVSLLEQQRAFIHGASKHICIIVRGVSKYVPVAPFAVPDFADLARVMVAGHRHFSSDCGSVL
jgi:hypothetical protein